MIITKKHFELIQRIKKKWGEGTVLDKALDELTEEDIEYLFHLVLAGIVSEEDGTFELTQSGHLLLEAINECLTNVKAQGKEYEWKENSKIIGSEIISMLQIAKLAQGNVEEHAEIKEELTKRGMVKDGRIMPVADSILKAYETAKPSLFIYPALAEKIKKIPPGPGKKSFLNLEKEDIFQLEAMRLLTFSVPYGNNYSLTGSGQQIRAGLIKGLAFSFPLTDEILFSLLSLESLSEGEKEKLLQIGVIDDQNNLLPAGKHLLMAAKLLFEGPITVNPSVQIDEDDFLCLGIIDELWTKNKENPDIYPSYKQIKEELAKKYERKIDHLLSLHVLESYSLVKSESTVNGKLVFELTELGKKILEDRKRYNFSSISSKAIMAISTTRMENLSPADEWVEIGEREKLIGNGYPTSSGRIFSYLASNIDRLPMIDTMQRKVLDTISFIKGEFEDSIIRRLSKEDVKEVKKALGRLVANGLVDLLPGGLYKITRPGEIFKRAMSVVPPNIVYHVTPHILRLLVSIQNNIKNGRIEWKKVERESLLDPEVLKDTIQQLRTLMYIKGEKLTTAGKLLIEGVEQLKSIKVLWEEIEL